MSRILKLTVVGLEPTIQVCRGWMAGSVPGHDEKMVRNLNSKWL